MDECLADMKEATDLMEEVAIPLPNSTIVYYTLKNLLCEYDVIKEIIFKHEEHIMCSHKGIYFLST